MHIEPVTTLANWLATPAEGQRLLCHPDEGTPLRTALRGDARDTRSIALLVGPEGGWSDAELDTARAAGASSIVFGARVLRTETAGLALVAAATALLGWDEPAGEQPARQANTP
jgi:16S rRNA (uracil1498-N3)-methyltransferase